MFLWWQTKENQTKCAKKIGFKGRQTLDNKTLRGGGCQRARGVQDLKRHRCLKERELKLELIKEQQSGRGKKRGASW